MGYVPLAGAAPSPPARLRPAPLRLAARWLDTAAGAWDDRLADVKNAAERG
jgi:hypothetical protein